MLGQHFEHQLIRKYISVFGTLFNNILIGRSDGNDVKKQYFKVPIEYGPREKYLAIIRAKPDDKDRAIQLPRISFEITGMSYDTTRKLNNDNKVIKNGKIVYYGSPWNFNFQLNIITKSGFDATKIVEQILMYFRPDYTVDVKLLDDMEDYIARIPIVYNGVNNQDLYEGDFQTRRAILWTIDFTLKGWLYGPYQDKKLIKFMDVRTHPSYDANSSYTRFTVQPGLTANGEPTSNIDLTVDYADINKDDDWDYIILDYDITVPEE